MEEVPAVVKLHLVELTHEPEMHHGPDPFALHYVRITALLVHRLESGEGGAHHGPDQ